MVIMLTIKLISNAITMILFILAPAIMIISGPKATLGSELIIVKNGSIICVSQKEHEQIMPHPGWVEHDPMTILNNVEVEHLDLDRF